MQKKLKLKIVTPERLILEEMVDQVSLPTTLGEITVLPDHIPLITELASGDVVAYVNGEHVPMAVVGGFIEVKQNLPAVVGENSITEVAVLADFAEHVSELHDKAIEKAKARAEELKKLIEDMNQPVEKMKELAAKLKNYIDFKIMQEQTAKGTISDFTRKWIKEYNDLLDRIQKAMYGEKSTSINIHKVSHADISSMIRQYSNVSISEKEKEEIEDELEGEDVY